MTLELQQLELEFYSAFCLLDVACASLSSSGRWCYTVSLTGKLCIKMAQCHCQEIPLFLQGIVQNENVGFLVQTLLRMSIWQQQSCLNTAWGPF